jgi:hypothetical protein
MIISYNLGKYTPIILKQTFLICFSHVNNIFNVTISMGRTIDEMVVVTGPSTHDWYCYSPWYNNVFSLSLLAGHNKLECLLVHFKRTVQLTTNDSKPSSYSNQIKRKLESSVLLIDLMTLFLF